MRITIEIDVHDEPASTTTTATATGAAAAATREKPTYTGNARDAGPAPVGLAARNGTVWEPPAFTEAPPDRAADAPASGSHARGGAPAVLSAGRAPTEEEIAR
ncbi:hypothetical protein ABZ926_35505 [Streptomyces litmocidini]|uniref:Uncharacterized protein n=1 Tax=Streptomyces litmocidini TaxID=67318 RepID=A0ABW7UIM8_9ACTN|nr:hypothetical protein [Streptomyces sp. PanSC19]ROQ33395.1 hypothetical protein EDD98_2421 [Streptomyces sp. PanSC19]